MRIFAKNLAPLWALLFFCAATVQALAQPYPQLTRDVAWSPQNFSTVANIAAAFGNARAAENTQLGSTISTTLTMPSQAVWDAWSASQKALYLINAERTARGLLPFEGVSNNIVKISQAYADTLLANDQFTHTFNNTTPASRLNGDPAINGCSEQGWTFGPECLSAFVQSEGTIPMPVERSVYGWIYVDSSSSWGHRNTCFAMMNNDFGPAGSEGFIGIGVALGGPFTIGQSWPVAAVIVFDFVDPCQTSTLKADQQAGLPVPVQFSPDSLAFGDVQIGQVKKDSINVKNSGDSSVTVSRQPVSDTAFTVAPDSAVIAAGDSAKFSVTFKPNKAGAIRDSVIFVANGTMRDTIAVTGIGVNPPGGTVSPRAIIFDSVLVLTSRRDSIQVRNTGSAAFTFKAHSTGDTAFTVSPDSAVVAGGDSAKFFVTFLPRASRADTGSILVTGPAQTDTVALSGAGKLLSLSAVRRSAVGTLVSFQGIVSRAKGSYVYMQDSLAGIVLFQSSGMVKDSVASGFIRSGDRLIVSGKTSMFNNLLELASTDIGGILRVARGDSITAVRLTLAQVAAQGATFEGMLVTVDSLKLVGTSDSLFKAAKSYNVIDTDTSKAVVLRIPNAGDSDVDSTMIKKDTYLKFTGPLGQFSSSDSTRGFQLMAVNATDVTWESVFTGIGEDPLASGSLPTVYALAQNYPNPFNPTTVISSQLPVAGNVKLVVYDVLGREVAVLVNERRAAGRYQDSFNASGLASGVYFYRLTAGTFSQVRKMLLVR